MTDCFATASNARLLVAEDDDTIRDTVWEALAMEGFIVRTEWVEPSQAGKLRVDHAR